MSKIIFWILVFFAILLVLRLVSIAKTKSDREPPRRDPPKAIPPAEPTVRCVDCGVFLPKAEASPAPTGYRCADPACPRRR